jgi:signal transduction histidine kinase
MGIPAEQRAFAMGRFARLDAARSLPGSGLGLSLALAVADLHKGRLVLADGDAGSGLRASLIVPSQV